eukprot:6174869-Pleurochrysis_carterae.AAC.4
MSAGCGVAFCDLESYLGLGAWLPVFSCSARRSALGGNEARWAAAPSERCGVAVGESRGGGGPPRRQQCMHNHPYRFPLGSSPPTSQLSTYLAQGWRGETERVRDQGARAAQDPRDARPRHHISTHALHHALGRWPSRATGITT